MFKSYQSGISMFHESFMAMNTRFDAVIVNTGLDTSEQAFWSIKNEVDRIENKISRFIAESITHKINRCAFKSPLQVDEEFYQLVLNCKLFSELTFGSFDITLYPLLNLWKNKLSSGFVPGMDEIIEITKYTGSDKIILSEENKSIRLALKGVELDFGAIGKGYALENIEKILKEFKISDALLSFGDSSVLAIGHHPYGDSWRIGMQKEDQTGEPFYFELKNQSLSTSGNSRKNLLQENGKYGKIINHNTSGPIEGYKTVSVINKSPVVAEVLSTALLACEKDVQKNILESFKPDKVIELSHNGTDEVIMNYLYTDPKY